jgi:L-ascorbate metabolism protein UlaG (beta-lactamase superfamily)
MTPAYKELFFDRPGHATVRIETTDGTVVYVDPWSEVIDGEPADADVVFSTHGDRDHYDPDEIAAVSNQETTVAVFEGVDASALNTEVVPLKPDSRTRIEGIDVRTVPAYNRPDGPHVRPGGEPYHPEGTVVGLVLTIAGTDVYYPSDTDALAALSGIDAEVVLPPIGGMATMDQDDASGFVREIDPKLVLPVHYDVPGIDGLDADAERFKTDVEADSTIDVVLF